MKSHNVETPLSNILLNDLLTVLACNKQALHLGIERAG